MIRPALLGLVLALAACGSEPAAPEPVDPAPLSEGGAAEVSEPGAPTPEVTITPDTRDLAERPTAPVRIEGACPFEGCTYGTWTTTETTDIYAEASSTARPVFTVPAGTALDASGGFVRITRLGKTAVLRPTTLFLAFEETAPLAPGDTLLVLDYEGEGSYRVWHDGQIGYSEAGGMDAPPGEGPVLRPLVEPEQEWWARVTTPDGRAGWLWMDRTPDLLGVDILAAP